MKADDVDALALVVSDLRIKLEDVTDQLARSRGREAAAVEDARRARAELAAARASNAILSKLLANGPTTPPRQYRNPPPRESAASFMPHDQDHN